MRTAESLVLTSLIMIMFLASTQLPAAHCATTYLPGVSPGQFIQYGVQGSWVEGNDTELENYIGVFSTAGINVTVLSVVNRTITFNQVTYNSTEIIMDTNVTTNVETGFGGGETFIASNLTAGDNVYATMSSLWINDTIEGYYLGQQLEINHVLIVQNQSDLSFMGLNASFNATIAHDYYWHKQSGMLLEMKYEYHTSRISGMDFLVGNFVLDAFATISNPPVIPEYQTLIIIPLFASAMLLSVIALKRRHKTNN